MIFRRNNNNKYNQIIHEDGEIKENQDERKIARWWVGDELSKL